MLLYDSAISGNCYKVRLLFALLGIEYERREVDVIDRSGRAELLGDLNPGLRVPTLVLDDGRPLAESDAILVYFGEGTEYLPEDRYERARVLQWMFFEQYSHEPYVATPRYLMRHFPADHPRRAEIPARLEKGRAAFAVMEQHLATREFFVDTYGITDIALYAYSHVATDGGHDLAPYPHVRQWLGRVAAQPGHISLLQKPG